MPAQFPPIAPVYTKGTFAARPLDRHVVRGGLLTDESTAFAYVLGALGLDEATNRVSNIAVEIYRGRTSSMLDDLAQIWWQAEHEGARMRPFVSLPIADRAELRARVKKLLADRVPDALGDQAVLEAETRRLLELPASALRRAAANLERTAARDQRWRGSGATAEAAIFAAGQASIAHIGDGRIVRWRRGRLEALTRVHDVANLYADRGEPLPERLPNNAIVRALGMPGESGEPDTASYPLEKGDVFLLMNGVLAAVCDDTELGALLRRDGVNVTTRLIETGQTRTEHRIGAVAVEIL